MSRLYAKPFSPPVLSGSHASSLDAVVCHQMSVCSGSGGKGTGVT